MFPVVNHVDEFSKHPELLEWYKTQVSPDLSDIGHMEMSRQPDGLHVWVYLLRRYEGHPLVGYHVFTENADGHLIY